MSRKIKDVPTSPLLDKVIPIEANMPHKVSEVICVKCGKRWISVRPKDTDTISRQAAIEAVMECYDNDELFEVYEDKLRELPPAQPERIKGRWICDRSWSEGVGMGESYGHYWKCDKCGHLEKSNGGVCGCNFCSNCGSDNREVTT